jgi:hypothetical protein
VNEAKLAAFLAPLTPECREVVAALRRVIRRAAARAEESVLWGARSYHRPEIGGRVKGAVCLIEVKGGVRLGFIHGARLADPSGLLRGGRVSKRHVPIGSVAEAERPEVAALVREAARWDPTAAV